jgi:hypothetical protein
VTLATRCHPEPRRRRRTFSVAREKVLRFAQDDTLRALCFCALLLATTARAQDAIVATIEVDHLRDGNGGGASLLWIHPRANDTLFTGGTFLSLPDARWAYATLGGTRRLTTRTMLNAEANLGGGTDESGGFRYVLLRGGVTRELLEKRLYGEAEWLQADVARQQDGILRVGATYLPIAPLTLRASVFESLFGDNDISLVTARADYDFGRITAIAGFTAGSASPVLVQQAGDEATDVREAFGGVMVNMWTIIVTAGEDRQRLTVTRRIALGNR